VRAFLSIGEICRERFAFQDADYWKPTRGSVRNRPQAAAPAVTRHMARLDRARDNPGGEPAESVTAAFQAGLDALSRCAVRTPECYHELRPGHVVRDRRRRGLGSIPHTAAGRLPIIRVLKAKRSRQILTNRKERSHK